MNRVYLSQLEQLKCNFCTQWFSVPAQYANLQKYSLNACQKCLQNFNYRLVDPTSFQIYDVVLIKTGIQLTNKQYQLTKRFQSLIKMHRDSYNLTEQSSFKLRDEDINNCDMKAQVSMHTQPIKERISQYCRKFLDGIINKWNDILSEIQKGSHQFDKQKQKIIKILSDRYYNFNKDAEKLLSEERIITNTNKLKSISEDVKKITSEMMLAKLKNFIQQYFGLNLSLPKQSENVDHTENKQNKTPNQKDKKQLRVMRQKLMKNSRKVQTNNQLKINISNVKQIKSSKKDFGKSSQKNLLKSQLLVPPLALKKQRSEKSIKTSRSSKQQCSVSKQKSPYLPLDSERQKVSKLLKQPNQFQTYMPTQPQKNDSVVDRTYGEKCLIQYQVELKLKTTLNDNICQLINENLSKGNLSCYLKSLEWKNTISLVRLVKVKMHDSEFDTFLNWLSDKSSVQILVITNNFLSQLSIQALYAFCLRHRDISLRQIYMGNNYIKPSKARKAVQGLRNLNIEVYL